VESRARGLSLINTSETRGTSKKNHRATPRTVYTKRPLRKAAFSQRPIPVRIRSTMGWAFQKPHRARAWSRLLQAISEPDSCSTRGSHRMADAIFQRPWILRWHAIKCSRYHANEASTLRTSLERRDDGLDNRQLASEPDSTCPHLPAELHECRGSVLAACQVHLIRAWIPNIKPQVFPSITYFR
jgi:hypothetical protein